MSTNKGNPRFANGKKIRSIYSPGYEGTRVPEGPPGNHRPLVDPKVFDFTPYPYDREGVQDDHGN